MTSAAIPAIRAIRRGGIPVIAAVCLAGCSQTRPDPLAPPEPPIVWPAPPDPPRVRFLGQLTGSPDVRPTKTLSQQWHELLYGPTPPQMFVRPHAVAVPPDGRQVAVADADIACVHVLDLGRHTYQRLSACGGLDDTLKCPVAVVWAEQELWVADAQRHALAVFDATHPVGRWVGGETLARPAGLTYSPTNDLLYASDAGAHSVIALDRTGAEMFRFGSRGTGEGQFNYPSQIACAGETLVVADTLNFRIQRFDLDGNFLGMFGRPGDAAGDLSLPKGVAVDGAGHIWVVDAHFENLQAFTPEGRLLLALGQEGTGPGEFWLPAGVFVDGRQRMWVADSGNHRVQVFELLTP